MAQVNRTSFKSDTASLYADNTTGQISPGDIRAQMDNIADSTPFNVLSNTPLANQLVVWSTDNTILGDAKLVFDGVNLVVTGGITVTGTVDGRDVATDGTKLDGIEAAATIDQTGAEIKTAYEAETNAFTDAQFTKLSGIETAATIDQTGAEIKTAYEAETNAFTDAQFTKLSGIETSADATDTTNVTDAGALMDSELADIAAVKAIDQGLATTDSPSFAALTTTGVISGSNVSATGALSNRNLIINGDMKVSQRYEADAVTLGTGNYVVDRFLSGNTTGTGTITGQQSTLGADKSFLLTATSAVTDLSVGKYVYGFFTALEGQNAIHLNGQSVTLSFTVETNWSGNLPVNIRNYNLSRSYIVDVAVVSGTNNVSVTLTLEANTIISSNENRGLVVTIGFNNEGIYTATTDAWVDGNKLLSTSSTLWAKTFGNFVNLTKVQLEAGSTATPFERRSYGDELARCQRYFEGVEVFNQTVTYSGNATLGVRIPFYFKVVKRALPTSAVVGQPTYYANASNVNLTDGVIQASSALGGTIKFANKTNFTGLRTWFHTADSEL